MPAGPPGLERGPGAGLRDAADLLAPAVEVTLTALKLGERDAAAAQLARTLATAIDEAQNPAAAVIKLGPLLLKVLVVLHATPAARRGVKATAAARGPEPGSAASGRARGGQSAARPGLNRAVG